MLADLGDGLGAGHAEFVEDQSRHQRGAIVAQTAMGEDFLVAANQIGSEIGNGVEFGQIGQFLVKNREIDIEALVRNLWNTEIQPTLEIDDRVDVIPNQNIPVIDHR